MWLKGGSQFSSQLMVIKGRYVFPADTDPLELLLLLFERRTDWDKNIMDHSEVMKISNEATVVHYAVKAPIMFMKARDFAEKRVRFIHAGTYYSYSSSVPDTECPPVDKYQRCENVFGGTVLRKEDAGWVYYTFNQLDYKVPGIPTAMVASFVAPACKTFHQQVKKLLLESARPKT